MKISISLPDDVVVRLDQYARSARLPSRSAAIQQAIQQLADPQLQAAYDEAWQEWVESGEEADWEATAADGLGDASR